MPKGMIAMSHKELDRLSVIKSITRKQVTQVQAAQQLNLSVRQIKRLLVRYRREGDAGLVSRRRGKPSNNRLSDAVKEESLVLVKKHYHDFAPTFACEKLTEKHELKLSTETLRQWMISEGLWQGKSRKKVKIHQERPRRLREGELVQIDGSPHDWFEGRAPKCNLTVFIDDATSKLKALHFSPAETTEAYMHTLSDYLAAHGRPAALYSDKHGIFRVNHADKEGELTQFTRALKTLDIEPIHANTPQAKGRVERANKTLQDRLVKEMRLAGINSIEQANQFIPGFIEDYNRRFAVEPASSDNAHRKLLHSQEELSLILSLHHSRKLTKNLTVQFNNTQYQLQGYGQGYRLRRASVTVCEGFDGSITLLHKGKPLKYRTLSKGEPAVVLADEKTVSSHMDKTLLKQQAQPAWKPAVDHPWKRAFKAA